MTHETIGIEHVEAVTILTLNRPEVKNALNSTMRGVLLDAIRGLGSGTRALVLTGAGDAFCSGQDVADFGSATPDDIERILREEYEPLLRAIFDCPVPVIAAVNGAAAGAGANLALAADVVIATESAYFVQAFTRIGLIPDAGGTYWLPRQVGFARAMGAALFAEPVGARQAADWGMIWEAVPDADFAIHWWSRARHLAAGPTLAYGAVKRAIRQSFGNGLDEQLALEARLQGEAGRSRDFGEGVAAFLEKRKPSFEGC